MTSKVEAMLPLALGGVSECKEGFTGRIGLGRRSVILAHFGSCLCLRAGRVAPVKHAYDTSLHIWIQGLPGRT